jgi:anti-sigma factor RsiW
MSANLNERDYELLSAYLDDALTASERAALEARLQSDAALRRELAALRQTVLLLRQLPTLKAPRDFMLDPRMVRRSRLLIFPTTRAFSALSAVAAMVMVVIGLALLMTMTAPAVGNIYSNVAGALNRNQETGVSAASDAVAQQPTQVAAAPTNTANLLAAPSVGGAGGQPASQTLAPSEEQAGFAGQASEVPPSIPGAQSPIPSGLAGENNAQMDKSIAPSDTPTVIVANIEPLPTQPPPLGYAPAAPPATLQAGQPAPLTSIQSAANTGAAEAYAEASSTSLPTQAPSDTPVPPTPTSTPSDTPIPPTKTPTPTPTATPAKVANAGANTPASNAPVNVTPAARTQTNFASLAALALIVGGLFLFVVAIATTLVRVRRR